MDLDTIKLTKERLENLDDADFDTIKLTQRQLEHLKNSGHCNVGMGKGRAERIVIHGLFSNTNEVMQDI